MISTPSRHPFALQPGSQQAQAPSAPLQYTQSSAIHDYSQTLASTSSPPPPRRNPQLGSNPYFNYPTPTQDEIDNELPPYWESENVPLGPMLDRLVRKGYGDLRILTEQTLPTSNARQKPRQVIEYAKSTRQLVLKYLAVLRWKIAVDIASSIPPGIGSNGTSSSPIITLNSNPPQISNSTVNSFPTPHSNSNDDSNDTSPGASVFASTTGGKGKSKAGAGEDPTCGVTVRGRVADARRLQQFLQHQNAQHEAAIEHVRHVTRLVETLRERNADLVTALSLLSTGTFDHLPTELTEAFLPRTPLTASSILSTIQHLNTHLLYRLRCVDYVPPELQIERVANGRVYVSGSGSHGWKAELTVVGFDDDSRWWLTGVGWAWKAHSMNKRKIEGAMTSFRNEEDKTVDKDTDEGEGQGKRFRPEERQLILDLANVEILTPRAAIENDVVVDNIEKGGDQETTGTMSAVTTPASKSEVVVVGAPAVHKRTKAKVVDAPLVRIYNFMQHLSLSYQLEVLFSQAMLLSRGRWRGHLIVDIDRQKKQLRLRYWIRQRPDKPAIPQQAAVGKRPTQPSSLASSRSPMVGATLTFSIIESSKPISEGEKLAREVASNGMAPTERSLRLEIAIKWEIGEAGVGGDLKAGDMLDTSSLKIDASNINVEDVLSAATRAHASQLTRRATMPLLTNPRVAIFPHDPPTLRETPESQTRPLAMYVPLPGRYQAHSTLPSASAITQGATTMASSHLIISVSSLTGYFVIEDTGAKEAGSSSVVSVGTGLTMWMGMENGRGYRARLTTNSVNEGKSLLVDDVARLIAAVIIEITEDHLRQLGLSPIRRLPLRPQEHLKADLHSSSAVFVPMPVSSSHYFVAKVTEMGIVYELLKLSKVPFENGVMRMNIMDRLPIKMDDFVVRRKAKAAGMLASRTGAGTGEEMRLELEQHGSTLNKNESSNYVVNKRDLKDMFLYCNALVAQTTVEQQLKDRKIPYEHKYPNVPLSSPSGIDDGRQANGPASSETIAKPNSKSSSPSSSMAISMLNSSRSPLIGMIPELSVNTRDLLKDGRAAEVAEPKVSLIIKDWWLAGKCSVETVLRLARTSSVSPPTNISANSSPNISVYTPPPSSAQVIAAVGATGGGEGASFSSKARAEGIEFDHATSKVSFHSRDIGRCVPEFLEQWERISKVIVVAGEVNRLHRMEQFSDLRMLAFDLRTATLQYSPGYIVAITYTPTSDSYEASFYCSSNSTSSPSTSSFSNSHTSAISNNLHSSSVNKTTGAPNGQSRSHSHSPSTPFISGSVGTGNRNVANGNGTGEGNNDKNKSPHEFIAPLLSHRLNELTNQNPRGGMNRKSAGRQFIQLLRSTLPFLLEVETLKNGQPFGTPALVVRSATEYRLVWDVTDSKRYAIDATLTPSYDQFLLTDASSPQPQGLTDYTCGPLIPIPNLKSAIHKAYLIAKMFKVETFCPTDRTVEKLMFAAKLDEGNSLIVRVGVIGEVLNELVREIWNGIGERSEGGKKSG